MLPTLETTVMTEEDVLEALTMFDQRIQGCLVRMELAPTSVEAIIAVNAANKIRDEKHRFLAMLEAA